MTARRAPSPTAQGQAEKGPQTTPQRRRAVSTAGGDSQGTKPRKPAQKQREPSPLEKHLLQSMRAAGLPEPETEYRFHPTRLWRLDFAFPAVLLAVEIEGGIYRGGGHSSVAGIKRDLEKGNALSMMGWRLLRFHGDQVRSGEATAMIQQALAPAVLREVLDDV